MPVELLLLSDRESKLLLRAAGPPIRCIESIDAVLAGARLFIQSRSMDGQVTVHDGPAIEGRPLLVVLGLRAALVGVCASYPDAELREQMRETLKRIETDFRQAFADFSGDVTAFAPARVLMSPYVYGQTQAVWPTRMSPSLAAPHTEQVFLIHRDSALLLWHAATPSLTTDPDQVAAMLMAIMSNLSNRFSSNAAEPLAGVESGSVRLTIESGPQAVLAKVTLHCDFHADLSDYDGDNAPFAAAASILVPYVRGLDTQE